MKPDELALLIAVARLMQFLSHNIYLRPDGLHLRKALDEAMTPFEPRSHASPTSLADLEDGAPGP